MPGEAVPHDHGEQCGRLDRIEHPVTVPGRGQDPGDEPPRSSVFGTDPLPLASHCARFGRCWGGGREFPRTAWDAQPPVRQP